MGKVTGFMEYTRELPQRRPVAERVNDWFEIYKPFPEDSIRDQGARCMDCGVPFCHSGCPVNNIIPDWNDLVFRGRWQEAIRVLHSTNNFPEFTGRICPAPCEASCVLGINEPPVTIKQIEKTVVDRAFAEGWIVPALLLTGGAEWSRDLKVPGRELKGIHFAMDFLPQQNRRCEGDTVPAEGAILATGKRVVIIGGGDTGADCLGTSHRQKALSVHQFELLPEPPRDRAPQTPWPLWPMQLRTESSHEEGGQREWAIATTQFVGDAYGNVKQLHAIRVGPPPKFEPIPGTETTLDVDLVLLAMGFLGPVRNGMLDQL